MITMTRPAHAALNKAARDQMSKFANVVQPSSGAIMMMTPTKPTTTALHRRIPTVSFKKIIAKMVMNIVFEKPIAVAVDSGKWMKAEKPMIIAEVAATTRSA